MVPSQSWSKGLQYLRVIVRLLLIMSGDVELNPGPLNRKDVEKILSNVDDTIFDSDDWNIVTQACHSLSARWLQVSCFLGLSKDDIDTIKENNPKNYSACWDEALSLWIKQNYNTAKFGAPSWRSLLKAIAPIDGKLFKELALKHQVIHANDELFGQESVTDHCELCGGLLCHNCKHCKQDCKHDGLLEESAAAMRPILDEAEYQLTGINDVIKALERQSDEISEQRISIRDRVEQHFKTLLESINKQKDEVVSTLDQLVDEKLENLAGQRDEVEAHRSKIGQLSLSLSRKTLDGDVSQETTEIVMQIKEMIDSFTPAPCEKADLDFIPNAEFDNACPQMGRIIQKLPISKCYSTGKGLKTAYLGTTSSTLIHLVGVKPATPDPLIFSELISDSNALKLTPIVTKKSPNQYELMYTPTTRGLHKLHVQINGEHIRGSPFDVIVKVPVDQLGTPVRVIQGVNLPTGIAVNKQGEVIVAEEGAQCVSIYNQMGEKLRCFGAQGTGNGLLLHPRGIAIDAHNNILIVDRGKNCIAVFSSEGVFKTAVGKFGSNELEFNNPLGIAINRSTNKIYVSDLENHRIQILNPDLTFLSCFGSYGSGNGQFIKPRDIALDSIGNVYVVDSSNHRIQVLTEKGEYLRSFGRQGGSAGELSWPSSICIDSNDTVYVTEDDNHRVSIFTCEGTFLTSFGIYGKSPGQFNVPHGIAVDVCDNLFVSDHHNLRLQIF